MKAIDVAEKYSVSEELVLRAWQNLRHGKAFFLGVSGRIGAGKDTVAPRMMEELGFPDSLHYSFAGPLRSEMDEVIQIIATSPSLAEAVARVERGMGATNTRTAVEAIFDEVKSGAVTSSYQRTPGTRRALQWWGTEVRRALDEDYWVKRAIRGVLEELALSSSVYVTDARFPNEADSVTAVGGFLLRLEVSEEEQARRIQARDGEAPKPEALTHTSETALDSYDFPHVIDTDRYGLEDVVKRGLEIVRGE